jgi:MFS family permease
MKGITRMVWMLSAVSLCTDMASEMLYPVMPLYLKYAGYSMIFIGVLEGFAEALAGLSKGYFGRRSDVLGRRLPFIQLGYALSAISKPMLAIFINPFWIFICRSTDRLGKGIRTGARDAMLSDNCTAETKGRVFGFHRSMDTFGAVLGPLIALLFLHYFPGRFRTLFLIAFLPGIAAIILTRLLREKPVTDKKIITTRPPVNFLAFAHYWKAAPAVYRRITAGLLFFALFNSSDVFLLLKIKETGLDDTAVIGIYIFYNLVYALLAYPAGRLADSFGLKTVLSAGLLFFSLVYVGFAFNENMFVFLILFAVYGIYAAATESIAKAWISNVANREDVATAIGAYTGFQSICSLLASSLCGIMWIYLGAQVTFLLTAAAGLITLIYFTAFVRAGS